MIAPAMGLEFSEDGSKITGCTAHHGLRGEYAMLQLESPGGKHGRGDQSGSTVSSAVRWSLQETNITGFTS